MRSLVFRTATTLVAQASLVAAVLLYFGWTRNRAAADYLGFAETSLDTTPQRYVMDGVLALFDPLLVATVLALVWRLADPVVVRWLTGSHRIRLRRRVCHGLASAAVLVPLTAWLAATGTRAWPEPAGSFSVSAGALLAGYAASLWARTSSGGLTDSIRAARPYALVLFTMLVFWTVGTFATIEGLGAAQTFTGTLDRQLGIVLYSTGDLRISAPGVTVTALRGNGPYHFRYDGLKMYSYSDGRLFLVPSGWTYTRPQVIVLTDDDAIRVEYIG